MGFLARLFTGFSAPRCDQTGIVGKPDAVWVYLKCNQCGELITLRIRKSSEIQQHQGADDIYDMFVNKTVVGNKCFNRMELRLKFDRAYRVVEKKLTGGTFVSRDELKGA